MKFRKKPVVIEAIQFTGNNFGEIAAFMGEPLESLSFTTYPERKLYIKTLEGEHEASEGDWIIRGVLGEFYPCKPEHFSLTYEAAE